MIRSFNFWFRINAYFRFQNHGTKVASEKFNDLNKFTVSDLMEFTFQTLLYKHYLTHCNWNLTPFGQMSMISLISHKIEIGCGYSLLLVLCLTSNVNFYCWCIWRVRLHISFQLLTCMPVLATAKHYLPIAHIGSMEVSILWKKFNDHSLRSLCIGMKLKFYIFFSILIIWKFLYFVSLCVCVCICQSSSI